MRRRMTKPKDEAWKAHVEEYDRDRFDSTSRHRRHCFDAGWEAALADTLGMLETLAKLGRDPVFKGLQVNYCPNADTFTYFNHRPRSSIAFQRDRDISRAEAEALLGGEGKAK